MFFSVQFFVNHSLIGMLLSDSKICLFTAEDTAAQTTEEEELSNASSQYHENYFQPCSLTGMKHVKMLCLGILLCKLREQMKGKGVQYEGEKPLGSKPINIFQNLPRKIISCRTRYGLKHKSCKSLCLSDEK